MIITEMTSRIKNIIFFKIIIITVTLFCLFYFKKTLSKNLFYTEIKHLKSTELLDNTQKRINALKLDKNSLIASSNLYQQLKQNENLNIIDCFDKNAYESKLKLILKDFNIKSEPNIYASSNSVAKKDQPKNSVTLKTSTINLTYKAPDFLEAANFAKASFEALPEYNLIKSIKIEKQSTITPDLAFSLETNNNSDLVAVELNMEVKEINLND